MEHHHQGKISWMVLTVIITKLEHIHFIKST